MSDCVFQRYRQHVLAIVQELLPNVPEETLARVELTPTRDPAHGDMATNAALLLAKVARRKPADIAADLVTALQKVEGVASVAAAGPGFVNITLKPDVMRGILPAVLNAGEAYGASQAGKGLRVNVEYVSANPTGPMHVGHCRGAVVGDALANLMAKAGFAVTKEFYINDAGAQVRALAWAAYWRYLQALGTKMTQDDFSALAPGGLQYQGEYLIPVGMELAAEYGNKLTETDADGSPLPAPEVTWLETVRGFAVTHMLTAIKEDLAALGVHHDVFTSEAEVLRRGVTDAAISKLEQQGLLYEGVLEPPKGKLPEDWEEREQLLFRSTQFGDDVDRPLRKSDGTNTYFANDIGYHADKVARGAQMMIDVWGADHGGYVKRMKAAVKAITGDTVPLEVVLCQIVHILRDGQPVKMSKRAGTFVTLRDLIDEVGRDAVRFTMLTRKSDAQMEFDLDLVVAQQRDNPVFYVQYAHARCRSVLRAAAEAAAYGETDDAALASASLESLTSDAEMALIRRLAEWPRMVEAAALAREPHRVAFYLADVAGDFHALWNRGRDDASLRFLQPDAVEATRARLALVAATAVVIRSGLAVMGVEPVEEMR
ncbi:arginine--tRNA ligase [Acetobacter pasteurianus]|uniref:Arginine--tRNA ligase n=2 Tax=Acetobacter pasteurianus TaxID=438 RepID=C7JE49_ACEP3|nr:arginine--tRNA ligase [Acetobacter pasteurianus]ASC06223.1 Arginine--tRNA ligase [Acetobacter pasteurianus subsp. pasteurianus]BAI00233.1 arginyl-tRNA synthetase [Acetobacter pasteurianus IFO 3283-01]BAI03286.1 arginyl-tRNA synthetase [Acetobacter pasteurianus IFO 3283-03]BAI06331.1 arginyl-tRNA synthetase [Acetobacter pasteurianus IFO 3283-07]BAI09381.1 arginyl-tRNA synthetase [Acetobacter pasteurianus IFO 3283-22]